MADHDAIEQALSRYHALKDAAADTHAITVRLMDEVRDLRQQVQRLVRQLDEAKRARRRDRAMERRLESEITSARNELKRKEARRDAKAEEQQELLRLVERCQEFLTSGGASIKEIEAGIALPNGRF
ncbi:hypothetical protein [Ferruginivarius sediminum]|uniref:Uncharacterized protein n=1 Tax=Ferruginivarius sediminum TaxID=2661937 RepID=A0A369THG6_9PROT|nr:hypothetical protein [Ferruginivarius sediminum]RDD63825.1 hypothetical protein DRB17_01265 [Ferruginivarius sediminum]